MFAGSPAFVFPVLKLLAETCDLVAVLTNVPAKKGRGKKLTPSPLLQKFDEFLRVQKTLEVGTDTVTEKLLKVRVLEVDELDEAIEKQIQKLNCDLLVCYAFGKIFSKSFLSCFRYGGINIHPSLLPRWRGASPVPFAIFYGDRKTGVCIQTISEKMDCGDILASSEYNLTDTESAGTVLENLTDKSLKLLKEVLNNFPKALKNAKPQNEENATYCKKLKREKINWDKSAIEILRTILALNPKPKAFSYVSGEQITFSQVSVIEKKSVEYKSLIEKKHKNGKILKADKQYGILVQTEEGILAIQRLQRQGKKEMHWKDFLNGYKDFLDKSFDS